MPAVVPFSPPHLLALAAIALVALLLALLVRHAPSRTAHAVCVALALLMLAGMAIDLVWEDRHGTDWRMWLPLQLCDLALFLGAATLLGRWQASFELLYFWAFAGSIPALLAPDVGAGIPLWRVAIYFALHGSVVASALVATLGLHLRPRPGASLRVFGITCIYAAIMAVVNRALDANFLYLSARPERPSPLDWFGAWPWYLVGAGLLGVTLFMLLELPFRLQELRERRFA